MDDRHEILKHVRVMAPTRVVTTTMEVTDPRDPAAVLFRVTLSAEVDALPPGVEIDALRFAWRDRRPRAAAAEGAPE